MIMIKCHLLYLILVGAFVIQLQSCGSVTIIDDDSSTSIESIARQLCLESKNKNQIGRISTVLKLANYFDNLHSGHELEACNQKYSISNRLSLLSELLTTGNENVCGEKKISAIESFHRQFISTTKADMSIRDKGSHDLIPKILRNFFVVYAEEVSRVCKENLVNNLELDIKDKLLNEKDYSFDLSDDFIDRLSKKMITFFHEIHSYDDAVVPWLLLPHSDVKTKKVSRSLIVNKKDDRTGETIRMFIVTKNPNVLVKLQQSCRNKFRPVYEQIITPIIRLADLGYSFTSSKLKAEERLLKNNQYVQMWYTIYQFCETLLPIKFYQGEELGGDDSAIFTEDEIGPYEKAEALLIEDEQHETKIEYEPVRNKLDQVDKLPLSESAEALKLAKRVKSNSSARRRNLMKFLVRTVRVLKKTIKSKFMFSSGAKCSIEQISRDNDEKCPLNQGITRTDVDTLFDEAVTDERINQVDENLGNGLKRQKRHVSLHKVVGVLVLSFILAVFVCCFVVIVLALIHIAAAAG